MSVVDLSVSQAELLEHHVARLASYSQKIVHTLAFATSFLARHQFEGENDAGNHQGTAPKAPFASAGLPGGHARESDAVAGSAATAKRQLRLSDGEILALFQSAQQEAAKEADWRGITSPAPARQPVSMHTVGAAGESIQRHVTTTPCGSGAAGGSDRAQDSTYLHALSHALQQPTHGLVGSTAGPGVACCAPIRVEALPGSALAEQQQQHEQQQRVAVVTLFARPSPHHYLLQLVPVHARQAGNPLPAELPVTARPAGTDSVRLRRRE